MANIVENGIARTEDGEMLVIGTSAGSVPAGAIVEDGLARDPATGALYVIWV